LVQGLHLEEVDLRGETEQVGGERLESSICQFLVKFVDLSTGPLFSTKLYRLSDAEYILLLKQDHMITDGVSNQIITSDLWALYRQAINGEGFSLPKLPIQFADYAVWQSQIYDRWVAKHEAFWAAHLLHAPETRLPFQDRLEKRPLEIGSRLHMPFGATLDLQIRDLARRENTLVAWVVLAAYVVLLMRLCRQDEMVVVLPVSGRLRPELKRVVGFLVSFVYLRLQKTKQDTFTTFVQKIGEEFDLAYEHFDFGHGAKIAACKTQVGFNWMPKFQPGKLIGVGDQMIWVEPYPLLPVPPYQFDAHFHDSDDGMDVDVVYTDDFISASTAKRFGRAILMLLSSLVSRPDAQISSVEGEFEYEEVGG
jgi:hypothetical protein